MSSYDCVIVGSGPNGLTAANVLADQGLSVLVVERNPTIGGGARSEELTLPGYIHDICSAIHPMGVVSPVFAALALEQHGVEWVDSESPLAHPFDDRPAMVLNTSLEETARRFGKGGESYRKLLAPFVARWRDLIPEILAPVRIPGRPILMARFGIRALQSCLRVASRLEGDRAPAVFAGAAAHSVVPLDHAGTASFGLVLLTVAHAVGWPAARGGSQTISEALATRLRERGGEVRTGVEVRRLDDLPPARAILLDLTPRQVVRIAADALPSSYLRSLQSFRYGPGIFKIDWALDGPIPWRDPDCGRAATVHVGGRIEEIASAERDAWYGRIPERPFVLVAQQSLFDSTRAPEGRQTGWAYCHVPRGSEVDMTDRIERQIERFAPGFRDRILARSTINARQLENHNPNMIGGDIGGGANTLRQFLARPVARWNPYATPDPRIFLCSSSTPPGGGVHGMCGYHAARSALRRVFGRRL